MAPQQQIAFRLPFIYRFFFLLIEPLSALVGAFFTQFHQATYLRYLDARSASAPPTGDIASTVLPLSTSVAMSLLANMHLLFALNEALVLRSTWDMRVWRTVLGMLLIADLGRLYSLKGLGLSIYYDVLEWNIGLWGNVPWVYVGAALRVCFLMGVGMGESKRSKSRSQ
ncbi:hypothetical protein E4U59_007423 [Claviceps monticola]|nr:hypothetical protein E4U59_007423 [Claviceps monticola]